MSKVSWGLAAVCAAVGLTSSAALETADLIVNIDAASLSALADGAKVSTWANTADGANAVGNFVSSGEGKGATYRATAANGVPAVYFSGTGDSTLECQDAIPATITGGDTWSVEAWVYTPTLLGSKTFFTWTSRGGANQLLEMRYGNDAGNAVEHHSNNVGWGGVIPAAGVWHYVAITRDSSGNENLYVDGIRVSGKDSYTALNIRNNAKFLVGGVKGDGGGFDGGLLYTGYIGAVRVHGDTLSAAQVKNNYTEEHFHYQNFWKGVTGSWTDGANWGLGTVPTSSEIVYFLDGGEATLDATAVTPKNIQLFDGGVVLDNGASITIDTTDGFNGIAYGAEADASLTIKDGLFWVGSTSRGSGTIFNTVGANGGKIAIVVGEEDAADRTAELSVDKDLMIAGKGTIEINDGGWVDCRTGWIMLAQGASAQTVTTVNGGYMRPGSGWLFISRYGGDGTLIMNDGLLDLPNGIYSENNNDSKTALQFNGGRIKLQQHNIQGQPYDAIYLNGGTFEARSSQGNFMQNYDVCEVQEGGVTFDVPSGITIDIGQDFTRKDGMAASDGAIVKDGPGRLNFKSGFAVAGPVDVKEGSVKFTDKNTMTNVTSILIEEGGTVLCTEAGGIAEIISRLDPASEGSIFVASQNAAEDIDLTGFPNVKVTIGNNVNYTGTITLDQAAETFTYFFDTNTQNLDSSVVYSDFDNVPTSIEVKGTPDHKLVLRGANTFTGGIVVDGTMLQFNNTPYAAGSGPITLLNNAMLVIDQAGFDIQKLIDRITADSVGAISICNSTDKNRDFSLAGHPGIYIGAYPGHAPVYTGTITPDDPNEYHFGGGTAQYSQNERGLQYNSATPIADTNGIPTRVVFGQPGMAGLYNSANSYTGGNFITNGATIFIYNNADCYGAEPVAPDSDFFYFDNGNIRFGDYNNVIPANRGVTVGPGGLKIHAWGNNKIHTFKSSIHGTGTFTITDSGTVVFAGLDNDFAGELILASSGLKTQIGSADGFSWDFSACKPEVRQGAYLILYIPENETVTLSESLGQSNSWLWKDGPGTLEITAKQNFGSMRIKAGTVAVSSDVLTPSISFEAGSALEIRAGATIHLDSILGEGTITAPSGTTATLVLGENGGDSEFAGVIADNVNVVKRGTGTAQLDLTNARTSVTVEAGVLDLAIPALERPVVGANGTLRLSAPHSGLVGKYWASTGIDDWKALIGDKERIDAQWELAAGATDNTDDFGAEVNVRGTGDANKFHPDFKDADTWLAVWKGKIFIEQAGTYGFASASDDGTTLFIDGEKIVTNLNDQGWNENQFENTYAEADLAAGWHDIILGFYDNTEGNEMTFRIKYPDAESLVNLPTSILFESDSSEVHVDDWSGVAGAVEFGWGNSSIVYDVDDGETETAQLIGGSVMNSVVKRGEGTLVIDRRSIVNLLNNADNPGVVAVEEGEVVLDGTSAGGKLEIAAGAKVTIAGDGNPDYRGLLGKIYSSSVSAGSNWASVESFREFYAGLSAEETFNSADAGMQLFTAASGYTAGITTRLPGKWTIDQNNFYLLLTGMFYAPADGKYTMGFVHDDGVFVAVDGVKTCGHTGCGSFDNTNTQIDGNWLQLKKGFHYFEFAFNEIGGGEYFYGGIKGQTLSNTDLDGFDKTNWQALEMNLFCPYLSVAVGLSGAAGSTLDLADGELWLMADEDSVFAGNVKGSATGWLVKDGEGTLTLSGGFAEMAGGIAVVDGELEIAPAAAVNCAGQLAVEEGAVLTVDSAYAVTFAGSLKGNGTVVIDGGAVLTVGDTDRFDGEIVVKNGKFVVVSNGRTDFRGVVSAAENATSAKVGVASGVVEVNAGDGVEVELSGTAEGVLPAASGSVALSGSAAALATGLVPVELNWSTNSSCQLETDVAGANGLWFCYGMQNQTGSAYLTDKVDVTAPWRFAFRYEARRGYNRDNPYKLADGFAFAIHNESDGAAFCDTTGTSAKLGGAVMTEHPTVIALYFNLWGQEECGWAIGGEKSDTVKLCDNTDYWVVDGGFDVEVAWDGHALSARIWHNGTLVRTMSKAFTRAELAAILAPEEPDWDGTAYMGFSAASGGSSASQYARNPQLWAAPAANAEVAAPGVGGTGSVNALADESYLGTIALAEDDALTLGASPVFKPVNLDYAFNADTLTASGNAAITLEDNGEGTGTLRIGKIVFGGGVVTVSGGAVEAIDGEIEIRVPAGTNSRIDLVDLRASAFSGDVDFTVKDLDGNEIEGASAFARNGKIYVASRLGTVLIFR